MSYLKHNSNGNKTKQAKSAKKPEDAARIAVSGTGTGPSLQHDVNYVAGLSDVEESLDWIARGLSRFTDEDHTVGLSLGQGTNTIPVKITLADNQHDDTMDRLVTAFERIADSVAKLAGFSRPRLEHWHEQAEYQPLYRDVACDGGAPGPSADVTGGGGGRSKV